MTKAQMAEYKVNGIGGNGNQGPEPGHGTFIGHVDSDGPSKFTANARARKPLDLDMDAIARARAEAEAIWEQE